MNIHIIVQDGSNTPEVFAQIITTGALTNANSKRAQFFNYRMFSATAPDEKAVDRVRAMAEVQTVTINDVRV